MFAQTFIAREIEGLARFGVNPPIFSIHRPRDSARQEGFAELETRVEVLPEKSALSLDIIQNGLSGKLPWGAFFSGGWLGSKARSLREAFWLGPRLRELQVRHLHTHFLGPSACTAWWLKKYFGISYSITAHANDFLSDVEEAPGWDALMRDAEFVVAVSDYSKAVLEKKFPQARIVRVYNGMSFRGFALPSPTMPPLLVSVGRLVEKKGFSDLVEICRQLRDRGFSLRCKIIGEGPLEAELRAQIVASDLVGVVELTGALAQPEIRRVLGEASAFVLPCVVEKDGGMDILPTVIMEAMAARLPIVSTRLAGIPEMVVDGKTGVLVEIGDVVGAASAVQSLLENPARARAMGEEGYQYAQSLFSEDVVIPQLLDLLRSASESSVERSNE